MEFRLYGRDGKLIFRTEIGNIHGSFSEVSRKMHVKIQEFVKLNPQAIRGEAGNDLYEIEDGVALFRGFKSFVA